MNLCSFADLSEPQRRALYDFIIGFGSSYYFDSYDEMVKDYNGIIFNNGTTYYSLWDGDSILGTIGIITKDVEDKGEVFVTSINILEKDKEAFKPLLEQCVKDALKVNPEKIKIGINSNKAYLIPFVEELGFEGVYKSLVLQLKSPEIIRSVEVYDNITFERLASDNKVNYKEVHNKGFLNSPNGSMLTDQQIDEMLHDSDDNKNIAKICYLINEPVGIYELIIKDHVGWIDSIAISPKHHGKGLGKIVLKTAVDHLYELGVGEVKLFVISSNENAYKLYLKYGFIEEKVTSFWFELDVK